MKSDEYSSLQNAKKNKRPLKISQMMIPYQLDTTNIKIKTAHLMKVNKIRRMGIPASSFVISALYKFQNLGLNTTASNKKGSFMPCSIFLNFRWETCKIKITRPKQQQQHL